MEPVNTRRTGVYRNYVNGPKVAYILSEPFQAPKTKFLEAICDIFAR